MSIRPPRTFITFIKIAELGRFSIVFDALKTIMTMRKVSGSEICHGAPVERGASLPVFDNFTYSDFLE